MGKIGGLLTGLGVTVLGILWFYGVMYSWLWLGLVHSTTTGWIVAYTILFTTCFLLSFVAIILMILGYILAMMIAED